MTCTQFRRIVSMPLVDSTIAERGACVKHIATCIHCRRWFTEGEDDKTPMDRAAYEKLVQETLADPEFLS